MKKKLIIMSLLISLLAVGASACSNNGERGHEVVETHGYQPVYQSLDGLAQVATDVIRGEVLDERVELRNMTLSAEEVLEDMRYNFTEEEIIEMFGEDKDISFIDFSPRYEIITLHRIKVLEVFQGDYQVGDIVDVMQIGGIYENKTVSNADFVSLQIGDDLVFFIRSRLQMRHTAALVNSSQSVYRFPPIDENARALDFDVELESVYKNVYGDTRSNDLRITLNDLLQLAEDQE